ncbi:polyprenol phosphomannose-dependent alpha 1,6 mannosyltransferase MptB [Austwickia sp. TVS 96-490-7B]|uniref:polyprenol phosphomannose-dependent alpha 1,6 mannosyltransferase MptB n=1 Tax=Austwickia sp. TVS 96-490-7B TaxID=2830843 RepID=UPI00210601F2|nr:polyprenol phosphomannose-dependent alpha 1,6 mannosyltransferase MptB [Austwickia sp. TVS 96-490-7B]
MGSAPARRRPAPLPQLDLPGSLRRIGAHFLEALRMPLVRRGIIATACISAGSMTSAFLPTPAPIVETLGLEWFQTSTGKFAATVILSFGVILLLDTWLRLRPIAGGRTAPAVTWALWAIPLLACPPLFSRDAYSYAAQGLVVARGMDPYQTGPVSVPGPFADQVDIMWFWTPAPYGPLALQMQRLVVSVVGGDAYTAAVCMRVPALLSMAVIAYALPRLADRVGVNRQQAIWLGVLNPLAMLHFVGGMHNDAMMVALTVFAMLLASRGHFVLSCIALAGATGFKQTAAMAIIGVVGLGMRYRWGTVKRRPYLIGLFTGTSIFLVAFEAMTLATGLGWGWVQNLAVPASIRSLLSPPTLIGTLAEWFLYLIGLPRSAQLVPVPLMQSIGLVSFAVLAAWLTFSLAPRRPVMAAALALIWFCLCGPVIHPWYMLWGGVLLAATKMDRRTFRAAIYVSLFLCTYSMIDAAFSNDRSALIVSTLALVSWGMQGLVRRTPAASNAPGGLLGAKPWATGPLEPAITAMKPEIPESTASVSVGVDSWGHPEEPPVQERQRSAET